MFKIDPIELEKHRKVADDFTMKYHLNHKHCPVCGSPNHFSTYVGYILKIDENCKVDESFKDENTVVCKCGWKGITHDLIPEYNTEKVMLFILLSPAIVIHFLFIWIPTQIIMWIITPIIKKSIK